MESNGNFFSEVTLWGFSSCKPGSDDASSYGLTLVFPGLGNHTFAFKHASFGVTFRGFLISPGNKLISQTMKLCNSITIFSCPGWIVRFCYKPQCFIFFNCLRKSNILLCHKKICSSFHKKDAGNIKYIEKKCQSTWTERIPKAKKKIKWKIFSVFDKDFIQNVCMLLKFLFH